MDSFNKEGFEMKNFEECGVGSRELLCLSEVAKQSAVGRDCRSMVNFLIGQVSVYRGFSEEEREDYLEMLRNILLFEDKRS